MTPSPLPEVYELLAREAHLLDDRDYEAWLELFTADCLYWMPVDPLAEDGALRLNVFYDDRARLRDRITRLNSGSAYTEEPISLTARTFSALQLEESGDDGSAVVRSNFQMIAYRSGEQRVLGGRYRHRLVRDGGRLLISEKRVTLLGSDAPQRPMTFLF
jgi:3-phenylpropionate/cinnamic acid dioxygenase small subunit